MQGQQSFRVDTAVQPGEGLCGWLGHVIFWLTAAAVGGWLNMVMLPLLASNPDPTQRLLLNGAFLAIAAVALSVLRRTLDIVLKLKGVVVDCGILLSLVIVMVGLFLCLPVLARIESATVTSLGESLVGRLNLSSVDDYLRPMLIRNLIRLINGWNYFTDGYDSFADGWKAVLRRARSVAQHALPMFRSRFEGHPPPPPPPPPPT